MKAFITSPDGLSVAGVDGTTGSLVTIDVPHHEVHEGEMFHCFEKKLSLAAATVKYSFLTNASKTAHLILEVLATGGDVVVDMYHTATATSGTGLAAVNRKIGAGNPTAVITSGVTSTDGTLFDTIYITAGNKSGDSRNISEWIIPVSNKVRIDLIGQAAGSKAIIKFHWYEE